MAGQSRFASTVGQLVRRRKHLVALGCLVAACVTGGQAPVPVASAAGVAGRAGVAGPFGAVGLAAPSRRSPQLTTAAPLTGHYPVAFILCDFDDWHYEPNTLAYYKKLWIQQSPAGTFSSLADYFHDVSF